MFKKLLVKLYHITPKSFKQKIGKSNWLKELRNKLLRNNGESRITSVMVNKAYNNSKLRFKFSAAIKVASKAKYSGIENTLLSNSLQLIQNSKNNNDIVVLDIGANYGYLSLVWAKSIANKGKIYAFEPNKTVYKCLSKNSIDNNLNFILEPINMAVGNSNEIIDIYVNENSSNSLNSEAFTQKYKIHMTTLDKFAENHNLIKCDLIKIDVDGIELEVLKGARQIIEKFKPTIIVETNNNSDIISWLSNINYNILDMNLNPLNKKSKIPLNIFAVPSKIN